MSVRGRAALMSGLGLVLLIAGGILPAYRLSGGGPYTRIRIFRLGPNEPIPFVTLRLLLPIGLLAAILVATLLLETRRISSPITGGVLIGLGVAEVLFWTAVAASPLASPTGTFAEGAALGLLGSFAVLAAGLMAIRGGRHESLPARDEPPLIDSTATAPESVG